MAVFVYLSQSRAPHARHPTDGLLQMRATPLIHAAHKDGVLAPDIPLDDIAGASRKPSLSLTELRATLDLYHSSTVWSCGTVMFSFTNAMSLNTGTMRNGPLIRYHRRLWAPQSRQRACLSGETASTGYLHISSHGAVFARAYNRPFYPDLTSPSDQEADNCWRELFELLLRPLGAPTLPPIHREGNQSLASCSSLCSQRRAWRPGRDTSPVYQWRIEAAVQEHRARRPASSRDPSREEVKAATVYYLDVDADL